MKVTAPLMSLDASGTLGKAFVASKWKGRNYMRRHVVPSNPRSDNQVANRSMMAFLSQYWHLMTDVNQALWNELASQGNFSPFNAYTRYNLNRWKQFQYPYETPTSTASAPSAPTLSSVVAGVGQFQVNITEGSGSLNWGTLVFVRLTSDPTLAKVYVRGVAYAAFTAALAHSFVVSHLKPGTYRCKLATFNVAGAVSSLSASSGDIVVT